MTNIAILGFGVVGGGVAKLIKENYTQVCALGGDDINIKYILDLRDFSGSYWENKIVHDFDIIVNDSEIDTVIEVMGGSHPAYEYTVRALNRGKNVITSNKEVVANFGDEFMALAKKNGVCYRFEASVGGGIPVITPLISCMKQNAISEVRGILNGTTNYILTKMFSFGESFASALSDAQARGYAEKDPTADIEGFDAARKIAILGAIVTGKLVPVKDIYTEGISSILAEDVANAQKAGFSIKLVGRCIVEEESLSIMVAPFMISMDKPLSTVNGVYNSVEVLGTPIDSVIFGGPGAGAGATASAVVGDLMEIMRSSVNYAAPKMVKCPECVKSFDEFSCRHYVSVAECDSKKIDDVFGAVQYVAKGDRVAFITDAMAEGDVKCKLESLGVDVYSRIRVLN